MCSAQSRPVFVIHAATNNVQCIVCIQPCSSTDRTGDRTHGIEAGSSAINYYSDVRIGQYSDIPLTIGQWRSHGFFIYAAAGQFTTEPGKTSSWVMVWGYGAGAPSQRSGLPIASASGGVRETDTSPRAPACLPLYQWSRSRVLPERCRRSYSRILSLRLSAQR